MVNDKSDNEKQYLLDIINNVSVYLKNTKFKNTGFNMKFIDTLRPETTKLLGRFDVTPEFLLNLVLIIRMMDIPESKVCLILCLFDELTDKAVLLLDKNVRKRIMRKSNYTNQTVKNNLKMFVRKKFMLRIANNHYEFNRELFGIGNYDFIKNTGTYRLEVDIESEIVSINTNLSR
jgi:hypothetical protein